MNEAKERDDLRDQRAKKYAEKMKRKALRNEHQLRLDYEQCLLPQLIDISRFYWNDYEGCTEKNRELMMEMLAKDEHKDIDIQGIKEIVDQLGTATDNHIRDLNFKNYLSMQKELDELRKIKSEIDINRYKK